MFANDTFTAPEITAALGQSGSHAMTRRLLLGAMAVGVGSGLYSSIKSSIPGPLDMPREVPAAQASAVAPARAEPYVFGAPSAAELRDWSTFRAHFIRKNGRVVDTYNNGISHTESQGLGMLFAVTYDDRETFDLIWSWTMANLSRPSDSLFCWRYDPNSNYPVSDVNNATDGDIYIAGALARAARRWGAASYRMAAERMAGDILSLLVMEVGGRTVLLPGADGFVKDEYVLVNPSYYVFPMLHELSTMFPAPLWDKVVDGGRDIVRQARFGAQRLPADWLQVSLADGEISLPATQPPRFSFDAVRVPLFAKWDHARQEDLAAFREFWGRFPGRSAAWVDLETGERAPFVVCGGVIAIAHIVASGSFAAGDRAIPAVRSSDEYYSAALTLLSRMALRETAPQARVA